MFLLPEEYSDFLCETRKHLGDTDSTWGEVPAILMENITAHID